MKDIDTRDQTKSPDDPFKLEIIRPGFFGKTDKKLILRMVVTPVVSLLLSAATFFIVNMACDSGSAVRRILFAQGQLYQMVIPFVINTMFFWALIDISIKLFEVILQYADLKNETISITHEIVPRNGIEFAMDLLFDLKGKIKDRLVFTRVFSLINHLSSTGDPIRCHEYIRHQIEIDSDTATSGYTTSHLFIWAMPILGFIGTVLGIGISVGGFSQFLKKDTQNVNFIVDQLGVVTSGLSFAFDTTLLGLMTSLFAMLLATFVQNQEGKAITHLDEICLKIIAAFKSKTQSSPPTSQPFGNPSMLQSIDGLKITIERLNTNLIEYNQNAAKKE